MTVATLALPAPLAVPLEPPLPRPRVGLGAVARRAGVNLSIGCLVPAAVFYTLFAVAGVWFAILTTLAWSYGTLAWRALTGRRTSALLLLTMPLEAYVPIKAGLALGINIASGVVTLVAVAHVARRERLLAA